MDIYFRDRMDNPEVVKMAKAIMAVYDEFRDIPPREWDSTDGTLSDYSRAKFLKAADDAFDMLDWTKFMITPTQEDTDANGA